jgi:signal transduction histidine kinase
VAIPARQTWRITQLLRESTQVLAPARLLVEKLQAGLAREFVAVQGYALTGDVAQLARYRASADEDERWLAAVERLASRFDATSADRARALRTRIGGWRQFNDSLVAHGASRARVVAVLGEEQSRYDASLRAIALLSSDLVADAAARDDKVRTLEHLSIASNAVLVLAALVAMSGVAALTIQERKLTATLRRRVDEEAALREAAESLGSAYTVDEVTQRIVDAALDVVAGRGAFVERIEGEAGEEASVVVRAVAGSGVPPLESACALAGSYTERVTRSGEPVVLSNLQLSGAIRAIANVGSAIVAPLGSSDKPTGALFVVSAATGHFHDDDVARAGIFGHLAALAYEKVALLEEAHERRRVLERVIQSRSRLMRGFSHDVKNPIGAADGFAELLSLGVYGELSAEQRGSIDRMRRSIRAALSLIDDLHELARAETGNLALAREPVDLAALVHALGEEYHGAAHGRGLSLLVEAEDDGPTVESDRARVRQIVANLLSNAIKYTRQGSITVRARRRAGQSGGDEGGGAVLEVADTGAGIAAEKQDYIFEEFSRLGSGDAGGAGGAGLGLAISNLLAQRLGGRISVESEVGRGSTFTLWLPMRRDESSA